MYNFLSYCGFFTNLWKNVSTLFVTSHDLNFQFRKMMQRLSVKKNISDIQGAKN